MEREHVFCAGHVWGVVVATILTHKTTFKAGVITRLVAMSMFVAKDAFSLPTSAWNCGVVVDGDIVVGAGVALLQVEGHPGELDNVAGRPHNHPATVHPVRILLRLRDQEMKRHLAKPQRTYRVVFNWS